MTGEERVVRQGAYLALEGGPSRDSDLGLVVSRARRR